MSEFQKISRTCEERLTQDGRRWKDIKDSVEIGGVRFGRSGYEINDEPTAPIEKEHFTSDAKIGVRCGRCLNDLFSLSYGDYEISACCSKCGFQSVVYDG